MENPIPATTPTIPGTTSSILATTTTKAVTHVKDVKSSENLDDTLATVVVGDGVQNIHPHIYTRASSLDDTLAKAFHAQCHVHNNDAPDWNADSGATDHMAPNQESLDHVVPYKCNHHVIFGNGKKLPITHMGSSTVANNIPLRNVLVIPNLTKKLLSISKLTSDHPVDVLIGKQNRYSLEGRVKMDSMSSRMNLELLLLKFLIRPPTNYGTLV
ncbi:ribonuclease H-like domain-containing protein [Artemisia annua]|uniref:Ribonuclease H-like domain-containing protein n=1 Tax=Artemisia annua TaxID=35608 RepID=A0A2U1Q520_ARTAN|nr:ribonuclease H-like domain-containing protein [Artemisia annua]